MTASAIATKLRFGDNFNGLIFMFLQTRWSKVRLHRNGWIREGMKVQCFFGLRPDRSLGELGLGSFLQELEHARAGLANFLQVDLALSKAVEEAIKAGHPIVPFR